MSTIAARKSDIRYSARDLKLICALLVVILLVSVFAFLALRENELEISTRSKELKEWMDADAHSAAVKFHNQTMNTCKWPLVSPDETEIRNHVNYFRRIQCNAEMPNLASLLDDGRLIITNEVEKWKRSAIPPFRCTFAQLSGALVPNITNYHIGAESEVAINRPTFIPHDQFVVRCYNETVFAFVNGKARVDGSLIYEKAFVNFAGVFPQLLPNNVEKEEKVPFAKADPLRPSLAVLVLDSTSLNQFRRHCPETLSFMKQKGFVTMNMYNKVADNSAVNLLPVLAGRPIQTDPLNPDPEDAFVDLDNVDFLWNLMKERHCATLINDDIMDPSRGLFHYPNTTFQGFSSPPTDFFPRAYHIFNTKHRITPKGNGQCMKDGSIASHEYLSHYERFSLMFRDHCHFSFNFLTAISHDDPSQIGALDSELRRTMSSFFANGVADNTVLVVMGDHGNRIHDLQRTFTGRVEERAPLFSVHFPDAWKAANKEKMRNLKTNANRLVTNFDIHRVLREIASGGNEKTEPIANTVDLLSEIVPAERTCEDAKIPPNFCLCMDWKEGRSMAMDNGTETYGRLWAMLASQVAALPCVESVRPNDFAFPNLQIYSLNQMVLHGLRDQRKWKDVRNYTVGADIEFVEIGALARTSVREDGHVFTFGVVARYKHYLSTDEFFITEPPRVLHFSCNAPSINEVCEMCYYDNFVAARNEEQVI